MGSCTSKSKTSKASPPAAGIKSLIHDRKGEGFIPSYSIKDIRDHNQRFKRKAWSVYNNELYDTKKIREVFTPLILEHREMIKRERFENNNMDGIGVRDLHLLNLALDSTWNQNGVYFVIRNGITKYELNTHLPECFVGKVRPAMTEPDFQRKSLDDACKVYDSLAMEYDRHNLTEAETDFMFQCRRWIAKHMKSAAPEIPREPPRNNTIFPLPESTKRDPGCLRSWIVSCEPLNTELPASGAAWDVLPGDVIADDICTERQLQVWAARSAREDFYDSSLVQARWADHLDFFLDLYDDGEDSSYAEQFRAWPRLMKEGWDRFQALCEDSWLVAGSQ